MINYTHSLKFWQEHSEKALIFRKYDSVFGLHKFTEEEFYLDYLNKIRLPPFRVPAALDRSFNFSHLLRLMAAFPDMKPRPLFESSNSIYPTIIVDYYNGREVNTFEIEKLTMAAIESLFETLLAWFMELSLDKLNKGGNLPIEKGIRMSIERWNNYTRLAMTRIERNWALTGSHDPPANKEISVYFPDRYSH